MPERPLLIFPEPKLADKNKLHGGPPRVKIPSPGQQASRLTPLFERLQSAWEKQRLLLQSSTIGIEPELTLVLETIGSVDRFMNALRQIKGFEWLNEYEEEDIEPLGGFEDEKKSQKKLKARLYLVMSDQRALRELLGYFSMWQRNPDAQFPLNLAPLRNAFKYLYTIRPWGAQDRIAETGLREDLQERLAWGEEMIPFEAELWFRADRGRREKSEVWLHQIISDMGGRVVQQCVLEEIRYHGILGEIPNVRAAELVADQNIQILTCQDIMYLRPAGQCAVRAPSGDEMAEHAVSDGTSVLPQGDPVAALFDGLPLAGHNLLNGRVKIDDPDDFEREYQAYERFHGTAMASLICHGDLQTEGKAISRPLYIRPILKPRRGFERGQFAEEIPQGVLPVDLIHRAVRRLYENEREESPAAPSVRVINISVCDKAHPFDRGVSALARLLDWLSLKYNVLFIVSAGNHTQDIELQVPRSGLSGLTPGEREKAVVSALIADTRNRRLLSPAETVNNLTIGATHTDSSAPVLASFQIDPFVHGHMPSPVSAQGPGYRRAVKPEVFASGGRQLFHEKLGNTHQLATLQVSDSRNSPGHLVATPGYSGQTDGACYLRGTSDSAAMVTHGAVQLFDILEELRSRESERIPTEYDSVLLKTLLVHGTSWLEVDELYNRILSVRYDANTRREKVGHFLGYGVIDISKVMYCTDQRVTVLGMGRLEDGQAHEFSFPLPPSLSAKREKRRLTITLAWFSPVNCASYDYRVGQLWFEPRYPIARDRINADDDAVRRGTVQHEVLEGTNAVDYQEGASINIKVNCRAIGGVISMPIRYGLAVTLEVAEGINIPIYTEVRDRIRIRIPVRDERGQ